MDAVLLHGQKTPLSASGGCSSVAWTEDSTTEVANIQFPTRLIVYEESMNPISEGLDAIQSPTAHCAQETFRPIPGLNSYAGVTEEGKCHLHVLFSGRLGLTCFGKM